MFLVDAGGNLLYYNEPAEELLGHRYEETSQMPLEEWGTIFSPTDSLGRPMPPEDLPLARALAGREPSQGNFFIRGLDGVARHLSVTAVPLEGSELHRVAVLLTHLHMDHIRGLGCFRALYQPGLEVHLWGPPSATQSLHARLTRYLSPPLFPVRLRDLPCRLELHDAPRGRFELPGLSVTADLVCHPGPTLGYRLEGEHGGVLAYISDHEPALGTGAVDGPAGWTSGYALARGADV